MAPLDSTHQHCAGRKAALNRELRQTDLALDVDLPNKLEDVFRIQLGSCHDVALRSRFKEELAAWLAVAVFQSIDRDLGPP